MFAADPVLRRSQYLSVFAHMGDIYLYHDLYGYIMQMSPDILEFLGEFAAPAEAAAVCERYKDAFAGQSPREFVDIFAQFACLVPPDEDELEGIWLMVAVKSKWNVWQRQDDRVVLYTAWGERPAARHELSPAETAIWDELDGEKRLTELKGDHDPALIADLVQRLVHHDIQALKLGAFPMSTYKGRRSMVPPYLTSTMPYAPYVPGELAASNEPGEEFSPASYYREQVSDALAQFEHQETTLSHMLREPHPALGGRTYGQALVDALLQRELVPGSGRVRALEIGAGLGYVARHVQERLGERGLEVAYDIVELSPALAAAQRERLQELSATVREGDILEIDLPEAGYDLILANEMIGDLPAVKLERAQVGLNHAPDSDERRAKLEALGDTGKDILAFGLELDDAPETFYLNLGACRLMRRLWTALAPGGVCVITEFGELNGYPRLSTQLDHPELSIHFGHLIKAAESVGFTTRYEYIIDLLDFDRSLEGLATTRSYFRALGMLLAEHGVAISKLGYTRDMFETLIAGKLAPGSIGELYFDRIEDRLMGLTPHEFKALILVRP